MGTWEQAQENTIGIGTKKNSQKIKKGTRHTSQSQFTVQKRTYIKHSIVKPKFQKNIPMSNHDLIQWC